MMFKRIIKRSVGCTTLPFAPNIIIYVNFFLFYITVLVNNIIRYILVISGNSRKRPRGVGTSVVIHVLM